MVVTFVLLDFAVMALLPAAWFRRGRLGLRWWLTALPFALSGTTLLLSLLGLGRRGSPRSATLEALAVALAALALGLVLAACAAHARPVALWHQPALPDDLVASGPYRHVRHPLYSAFALMLVAGLLALPHVATATALAWGLVALRATALAEERQLLASPLGPRYRAYCATTGRFLPRLGGDA